MALDPKPITLTQSATNPSTFEPQPFVVVGSIPVPSSAVVTLTAVPGTFADEAAVQAYLNTLVTQLKSSPYFN